MHEVQVILGLLILVAAIAWVAVRLKIPYPILLVLGGTGISLFPQLPRVTINPDIVFLLFLPPLLYFAALNTSWRDFRANLRPILLLAVGLVLFTMVAVAVVTKLMLPQLSWVSCFVLGAIISPPDAVAATTITQRLRVPKRIVTILEGESLVNDATALVALKIGIGVAIGTMNFHVVSASGQFLFLAVGGIVIGYFVGMFVAGTRRFIKDDSVEILLSLLTPYMAYIPAELCHVSGVLAAVTCGLYMNRRLPKITTPQLRLRVASVWDALIFLLNGIVFILIGLQLPAVIERLKDESFTWPKLILIAAGVSVTAIVVRIVWVYPAAYLPRLIPSVRRRDAAPSRRQLFLVAWTSMRGIVSLAAALALPAIPGSGEAFPGRDLILFITFGVIFATLVLQGLTLPWVIRSLKLPPDDVDEREESLARLEVTHAALARLEAVGIIHEGCETQVARVRSLYDERLRMLAGKAKILELDHELSANLRSIDEIRREALEAERLMLIKLRDDNMIGDEILRKIQTELDLEESKLSPAAE